MSKILGYATRAAAAAALIIASASSVFAQEYTFKLHHLLSAKAPAHTKMLVPWAEQVREKLRRQSEDRNLSGDVAWVASRRN